MLGSLLRHKALWLVLIALVIVQLVYGLTTVIYFNPSVWIGSDFAAYVTAMLQHDIPGLLPKDSLFGDGRFADTLWASSWIFMTLLQTFYHLGGERIEVGAVLFGVVLLIGYLVSLYGLALAVLQDRRLAIGVAVCGSLAYEIFLIGPYILAQALFATLTPLLLLLLLRVWLLPGLARERIVHWQVFLGGFLVGLTPFLVNSTNALGFMCFTLGLAGLQWLWGRLPLWTIVVFLAALLPLLALRIFGGIGVVTSLSASGIQFMAALYQNYENNVLPYSLYALMTVASGAAAWRYPSWRLAKIVFITTQLAMSLAFFYTGWAPFFIWLYGMHRIVTREDDDLDIRLLLAVVVAIWVGPLLQLALYFVWRITNISLLVGIIFETARFARYGYLPLYLLAARAVAILVSRWHSPKTRTHSPPSFEAAILQIILFTLLVLNALYNIQPTLVHWALVITAAGLLLLPHLRIRNEILARRLKRVFIVGAVCITLVSVVTYFQAAFQLVIGRMSPMVESHYALTTWARENTPPDSLFHLPTLDESFRFLAQRSMLIAAGDVTRSLYSTRDPYFMQSLINASLAEQDAMRLTGLAAQHQVNYVVLPEALPDMLPSLYHHVWYIPELAYQNAHYRVYEVVQAAWLDDRLYPLSQADATALANFEPDFALEKDSVVFNPLAGDIFNERGIENWLPAYALRDDHAPEDVFTLTRLVQHMQSAQELEAAAAQKWLRNYLPGDLKAANVDYVFITQPWLDAAGSYVQALFADDSHYQLVRSVPGLINPETYLLYRVVGDAAEDRIPPPVQAVPLPIEIPADAPLLLSAATGWRSWQLYHSFIQNRVCSPQHAAPDCPLFISWLPQGAGREALAVVPDNLVNGMPTAAQFNQFIQDHDVIFVVGSSDASAETRHVLAALAADGYTPDGGKTIPLDLYPSLSIAVYQLRRTPTTLETIVQFGAEPIVLRGAALLTPKTLAPCDKVGLSTWWQHAVVPADNYFVTLRLVAEDDTLIAQSDGRIGEHRLSEIPAGALYYDDRWLNVPCDAKPGIYTLQAGLYSYNDGVYGALLTAQNDAGEPMAVPVILQTLNVE